MELQNKTVMIEGIGQNQRLLRMEEMKVQIDLILGSTKRRPCSQLKTNLSSLIATNKTKTDPQKIEESLQISRLESVHSLCQRLVEEVME